MTETRPKPLVGALLGVLLGLVTMALLTVLGILAPDRLPLFGIVGVSMVLVSAVLTQRLSTAKARLITVIVLGAVLCGVGLTGIPEVTRGGAMTGPCTVEATSSLEAEALSPADTTIVAPFDVTTTDTIAWSTTTEQPVTAGDAQASVLVGGFAIPFWNGAFVESPDVTTWSGESSVETQLDDMQDMSGVLVTGTYHLEAVVDMESGQCRGDAYLRIAPEGTFSGLLLVVLWSALAVLVIAIIALAVGVRRAIRDSDETVAMVGTSAIPGSTSTTPPPTAPREPGPAEDRPAEAPQGESRDAGAAPSDAGTSGPPAGDDSAQAGGAPGRTAAAGAAAGAASGAVAAREDADDARAAERTADGGRPVGGDGTRGRGDDARAEGAASASPQGSPAAADDAPQALDDDADLESSSEAGPDELSEDADAPGSAPGEGERDEDASDDAADDDASRDGASDDDALSRSPYALPDSDPEPGSGGATDGVDEDRGTGADGDGEDDGRP